MVYRPCHLLLIVCKQRMIVGSMSCTWLLGMWLKSIKLPLYLRKCAINGFANPLRVICFLACHDDDAVFDMVNNIKSNCYNVTQKCKWIARIGVKKEIVNDIAK